MVKIAAIIILYHPEETVLQHILSYADFVERIYIFDNTELQSNAKLFSGLPKAEYFHDGENRGIAERLNKGCRQAMADGFAWGLTMDQDTHFLPQTITNYMNCFNQYPDKKNTAAIVTKYGRNEESSDDNCIAENTDDTITSGMLLNLEICQQLGGFDDALFIDWVDQDYCMRARMNKYRVFRFANIHIQHHLGTEVNRASVKSLYLIRKKKTIHSPLRCYYMYRNMLYIEKKYYTSNPEFAKMTREIVEIHMKRCLLYNRQPRATRKYIKIAEEDFAKGQMGKIEANRLLK